MGTFFRVTGTFFGIFGQIFLFEICHGHFCGFSDTFLRNVTDTTKIVTEKKYCLPASPTKTTANLDGRFAIIFFTRKYYPGIPGDNICSAGSSPAGIRIMEHREIESYSFSKPGFLVNCSFGYIHLSSSENMIGVMEGELGCVEYRYEINIP